VDLAVRSWGAEQAKRRPELERLGYFGSYARGDCGVGSDLDLIAIVAEAIEPFERRSLGWDLSTLPVPAEILVYTRKEWRQLTEKGQKFAKTIEVEGIWIYRRPYAMFSDC